MTNRTLTIQIPEEMYERAQQVAEESHRSIESVVLNTLALLYGALPEEVDLTPLETFTDEQLWRIVWRPLPFALETRLDELSELGDWGKLTDAQKAELDQLVAEVNRYVLIRSKALVVLKKRGHDVESRLLQGA